MHPPVQLDDSVDSTSKQDASLHMTLPNVSLTEVKSEDGRISPAQRPPPLPLRKDASSSITSLNPPGDSPDGRRKLLLIYIHGFMGAEDSFRKFPAHVHNLVTNALAESHVVYSKIYPRYKSRRAMSAARDEFSDWLLPHESDQTDVILLGHSLGGILAAELALAETEDASSPTRYRHPVLGTINFDVPFLGMHPSVVSTGLSSLFHPRRVDDSSQEDLNQTASLETTGSVPSDQSSQYSTESTTSSWYEQVPDSNFDPPFLNDVHRVKRNQLNGALHFFRKNSGNLRTAVKEYASSYFEFGGCLADYSGLRRRYALLKERDGIDDLKPKADEHGRLRRRLRFVNYYTASPGFPRKSPSESLGVKNPTDKLSSSQTFATESLENLSKLPSPILPTQNIDDSDDHLTEVEPSPMEESEESASPGQSFEIIPEQSETNGDCEDNKDNIHYTALLGSLPPLPTIPPKPPSFDPSMYNNKEVLKQAQKEHARLMKLHERAQKELDTTLKEREKLAQRLIKKKQKPESLRSESRGDLDNGIIPHNEHDDIEDKQPTPTSASIKEESPSSTPKHEITETDINPISPPFMHESTSSTSLTTPTSTRPPKDRLFCALPPSPIDPLWVRIFIPDVDQVVAHQSIFLPNGLYYEWLVNDTAARIEQWVQDDCTRRAIWEQFGEVS